MVSAKDQRGVDGDGGDHVRIWLFCICRNEARIMPYLLRHYCPWVTKLIFYDDQSDDGTREIIQSWHNTELRNWPGSHGIVDDEFLSFANEQWKEARGQAEWVIWIDADEFLYNPDMTGLLLRYLREDVNIPQVEGFTMVSDHFPTTTGQIYDEIKTGFRDGVWDKKAIFRENMIWNMGRHSINHPALNIKSSVAADIKLLHYRCLGMEYLRNRHLRNWSRVPEHCRRANLGTNTAPDATGHHTISWFDEVSHKPLSNVI